MAKNSVRKCMHCRSRAVVPAILLSYATEAEHDGRKYSFSVPNLEVLRCENCGAIVLNDAANERIEDTLRATIGLLSPLEIRQKREALGLNQQELADYLRISMHTLSRWETGAQLQQRVMDTYLRLFFEVPEARRYLGVPTDEQTQSDETPAPIAPPGAEWMTADDLWRADNFADCNWPNKFTSIPVACDMVIPSSPHKLRIAV
jgi:DNA-binding transcriptional regulator YiaG